MQMTAETSTTISSISGSNINTISGASTANQRPPNVQKRTIHQFETDKIEVQHSELTQAPPSTVSKVSRNIYGNSRELSETLWHQAQIREGNSIRLHDSRSGKLPGLRMSQKAEYARRRKRCSESENGENYRFSVLFAHPWRWFFPSRWPIFPYSRHPRY